MIGRADDKGSYGSFEDFGGKTVAVQAGTSYVDLLNKVNEKLSAAGKPTITLQTYPKQTDAIQQVLVGRAVASISQDTELAYRDLQQPGALKVLYAAPEKDQYAAYIRKDAADAAALKEAVAKLAADGKLKEIAAKWKMPAGATEGIGS
jgi:polar amino acid transport system substrate-binding protein